MNLLEALKEGDEYAFESIYSVHKKRVYSYLLRKCNGNTDDAEELLQITFCKLWRYRKSINPDFNADQHLFNITRQVFIDHMRAVNNRNRLSTVYKKEVLENNDTIINNIENLDEVKQILKGMPEIRRQIIWLNRIEGYSYQEIASQLSVSVKTIDNHLSKGLKSLRNMALRSNTPLSVLISLFFFS